MATHFTVYFKDGSYFDCKTADSSSELRDRVIRSMKIHELVVFESLDSQFVVNSANMTFLEIKNNDGSEEMDQ